MKRLFQEAFDRGFSAGLAKGLKKEIKMSLISNDPEVKECASEIVDILENEANGASDFVKLINVGVIDSPRDCFNEVRDYYVQLSKPYSTDVFVLACKILFDAGKVIADSLPLP